MRRVMIAAVMLIGILPVAELLAEDVPHQSVVMLLEALNGVSREAYGAAKLNAVNDGQAVFVAADKVILFRGEQELGALPYTPPVYAQLKAVSHLVFGTYGAVTGLLDEGPVQEWSERLTELRQAASAVKDNLDDTLFSPAQKTRQVAIIDTSVRYIENVLMTRETTHEALTAYMREMAPLTLANANDAAVAQIDMLDNAVTELKKQLTEDEFRHALALVLGPKMPRDDFLASQYFAFIFNEDLATTKRIVYAENIFNVDEALGLLRTFLADRRMSTIAFGNPGRMERDFMGDAATAELLRRFGMLGPVTP